MAIYVNNKRVEELNSDKYYDLVSYTCSNFNSSVNILFNANTQTLNVPINKQTKCSLYFEEIDNPVYTFLVGEVEEVLVIMEGQMVMEKVELVVHLIYLGMLGV